MAKELDFLIMVILLRLYCSFSFHRLFNLLLTTVVVGLSASAIVSALPFQARSGHRMGRSADASILARGFFLSSSLSILGVGPGLAKLYGRKGLRYETL